MNDPGRPASGEYASFYAPYVEAVPEGSIVDVLRAQQGALSARLASVPAAAETFRYAPGKWCVREVVSHLADAERVFGYRAFAISRGETQMLPGFDENTYVARSGAAEQPLAQLALTFDASRTASLRLFESLDEEAWRRMGRANEQPVSVRALAYIAAGHVAHHLAILRTRYGVGA